MRVLVCGGRYYTDRDHIHNTITLLDYERGPFTCIIHGCASGADTEAMLWVQMMRESGRKIFHAPFAADWFRYGRKAGVMRNRRMLEEGKPDLVIAFPGGHGTRDMVQSAKRAGVKVIEIPAREGWGEKEDWDD